MVDLLSLANRWIYVLASITLGFVIGAVVCWRRYERGPALVILLVAVTLLAGKTAVRWDFATWTGWLPVSGETTAGGLAHGGSLAAVTRWGAMTADERVRWRASVFGLVFAPAMVVGTGIVLVWAPRKGT